MRCRGGGGRYSELQSRYEGGGCKRKMESYISRCIYSTAHHNNLLDPEKRLWIRCCSNGKVRQWPHSYYGNRIWFILPKQV